MPTDSNENCEKLRRLQPTFTFTYYYLLSPLFTTSLLLRHFSLLFALWFIPFFFWNLKGTPQYLGRGIQEFDLYYKYIYREVRISAHFLQESAVHIKFSKDTQVRKYAQLVSCSAAKRTLSTSTTLGSLIYTLLT